MVRPLSRNRDLYTAKMAKATETPSGFSTWKGNRPGKAYMSARFNPYDKSERTLNLRVLLHQRGLTVT